MEKRKYIQFISAAKICHWHIKRFRPTATGVVNQDINFTQLTDGKVCQCREFLFGSNIAAAGKCLTTQLLNFIYNMISCIGVNITDHHRCASCRECNGDFFTNTCTRTCDDGAFSVESQVVRIKHINLL